jgi:hypothetical protein
MRFDADGSGVGCVGAGAESVLPRGPCRGMKSAKEKEMLRWCVLLVALSIAGEALGEEIRFRVINGTAFPIRALMLSETDMNNWGPNVLHAPSIKPGDMREVAFQGFITDCNVDLKVAFDTIDAQPRWQYLNLCNLQKIRLRFDQMSGITTASYEE